MPGALILKLICNGCGQEWRGVAELGQVELVSLELMAERSLFQPVMTYLRIRARSDGWTTTESPEQIMTVARWRDTDPEPTVTEVPAPALLDFCPPCSGSQPQGDPKLQGGGWWHHGHFHPWTTSAHNHGL